MSGPAKLEGPIVFDGSCLAGARPSGVERSFLRTLRRFLAAPEAPACVLFLPATVKDPHELRLPESLSIHVMPRKPLAVWRRKDLPRELETLHASLLWTPTTALPPLSRCPAVATVHELPAVHPAAEEHALRALRQERAREALAERAWRIVVPSRQTQQDLSRENPDLSTRIRVIPQPLSEEVLEQAQGLLREEPVQAGRGLLFVGLARRRKNLDMMIRAWQLLAPSLRSHHPWTWFGGNPKVSASVPDMHSVPVGCNRKLVASMRAARGILLPSRSEGFGLPALEALACGRPPLVAEHSAPAAICGELCAVCDPYDPASIAAGMQRLVEDEELAQKALRSGPSLALQYNASTSANAWRSLIAEC